MGKGKYLKRICAVCAAVSVLALCCSCGFLQKSMRAILSFDSTNAESPYSSWTPMLPQSTPEPKESAFVQPMEKQEIPALIDTENLLGTRRMTKGEIETDIAYSLQETGYYVKNTPFMGKDGMVELGFDISGKNDYIHYSYVGDFSVVGSVQVLKEFSALYEMLEQSYGKANLHIWEMSPTGFVEDGYMVGEFSEEDIRYAAAQNLLANFQYMWRRVADTTAYATLFLPGDQTYQISFIYDSVQLPLPRMQTDI